MTREEVYEKLNKVFQDVFDDESIVLKDETVASDIEDWDSLMQINILVSCEKVFGIKFSMNESSNMKNIGEMVSLILEKKK